MALVAPRRSTAAMECSMLAYLLNSTYTPSPCHSASPSQGVSVLALESPFYGPRRPEAQRGSKLRVVSDLLTLGWATIFESICLLHMMRTSRGYQRLGEEARGCINRAS